jgi:hypothetical protein
MTNEKKPEDKTLSKSGENLPVPRKPDPKKVAQVATYEQTLRQTKEYLKDRKSNNSWA